MRGSQFTEEARIGKERNKQRQNKMGIEVKASSDCCQAKDTSIAENKPV
jgi:hypothetical protein